MMKLVDQNETQFAEQSLHKLFILRLWRETHDGEWRIAIQRQGGKRPKGVRSLDALMAFLSAEVEQ